MLWHSRPSLAEIQVSLGPGEAAIITTDSEGRGTSKLQRATTTQLEYPWGGNRPPYWKEVTTDDEKIGEVHLHFKGIFIIEKPFGTYKDAWVVSSLTCNLMRF
ncbi:MAG: hypothetical protein ACJAVK_001205 [Akkermansiaceae bacterium]|jgi:hypothetical protein